MSWEGGWMGWDGQPHGGRASRLLVVGFTWSSFEELVTRIGTALKRPQIAGDGDEVRICALMERGTGQNCALPPRVCAGSVV